MGKIIAGMASSHAFALVEPTEWDEKREMNRSRYARRHGTEPPIHPQIRCESLENRETRYRKIREGLDLFRDTLKKKKPHSIILIGDDQNENFKEDNVPQIAIYVGDEFYTASRNEDVQPGRTQYACDPRLALDLLNSLIDRGFDVSFCKSLPQGRLVSHALVEILRRVLPDADVPVIPIFVNAIHVPAITPARCYRLGYTIKEIIEGTPDGQRVALYGSGGLSHFTGSYPWSYYKGPYTYGCISEEFDRKAIGFIASGEGEKLSCLTSQDLLDNGDVEMRSWIVVLGAMGKSVPQFHAYEPFYSGIMGMAVAYWELEDRNPKGLV
jgi:hypothetical protein